MLKVKWQTHAIYFVLGQGKNPKLQVLFVFSHTRMLGYFWLTVNDCSVRLKMAPQSSSLPKGKKAAVKYEETYNIHHSLDLGKLIY